jgi:hypothetical protein
MAVVMLMVFLNGRCLQLKEQQPKGSLRCAIFSAQEDYVGSTVQGTPCQIQRELNHFEIPGIARIEEQIYLFYRHVLYLSARMMRF